MFYTAEPESVQYGLSVVPRQPMTVVELLEALAAKSENTLDDQAVAVVRGALLPKS